MRLILLGLSGSVLLDKNADRIGDYSVWHLSENANSYVDLLDVILSSPNGSNVNNYISVIIFCQMTSFE